MSKTAIGIYMWIF